MIQKQTVRQRKAIKKVSRAPDAIVNDVLYSQAWREKGSDFQFTRLALILLVLFALTFSSMITPFRAHFATYLTTGVVTSWWPIVGYIVLSIAIFSAFVFVNGKIDKAVRTGVQARFEELKRDYWANLQEQKED